MEHLRCAKGVGMGDEKVMERGKNNGDVARGEKGEGVRERARSSRRAEKENEKEANEGRRARYFEIEQRVLEGTRGVPDGKVAVLRTQRARAWNPSCEAQCDDSRGRSPKGAAVRKEDIGTVPVLLSRLIPSR